MNSLLLRRRFQLNKLKIYDNVSKFLKMDKPKGMFSSRKEHSNNTTAEPLKCDCGFIEVFCRGCPEQPYHIS